MTTPAPCDACGTISDHTERATVAGISVRMCVDPTACRRRCEAAGVWCTYRPEARKR